MIYAAETCSLFGLAMIKIVHGRIMFLFCITQDGDDMTLEGYVRTFETIPYFPIL